MGQHFGPFELHQALGKGGMGEVFLATRRDAPEAPPVVLKRIRPEIVSEAEYHQRLILEVQVASRVRHPNLVKLLDKGRVGECPFLVMEHVKGFSLKRLVEPAMAADVAPPAVVGVGVGLGLLEGLAAMHAAVDDHGVSRPIAHRDVTPANVIITHGGDPVLIDFGIAKDVLGPSITQYGTVVGTIRYMAPEHRRAEFVDTRADVFSASMIIYELLAARPPWPPLKGSRELLRTVFEQPAYEGVLAERVPADIWPILMKGLANEADERFVDAGAMVTALRDTDTVRGLGGPASIRSATQAWIAGVDIDPDEDLNALVVDHAPATHDEAADGLVWSPAGELQQEDTPAELRISQLPPAKNLTIPPLPPRRDASLRTSEMVLPPDLHPGRRYSFWVGALVALGAAIGLYLSIRGG